MRSPRVQKNRKKPFLPEVLEGKFSSKEEVPKPSGFGAKSDSCRLPTRVGLLASSRWVVIRE